MIYTIDGTENILSMIYTTYMHGYSRLTIISCSRLMQRHNSRKIEIVRSVIYRGIIDNDLDISRERTPYMYVAILAIYVCIV